MAAIRAYGHIWKDSAEFPGIWTAVANFNGLKMTGFALVKIDEPFEDVRSDYLRSFQNVSLGDYVMPVPFGDGEAWIWWIADEGHPSDE